MVLFSRLTLHFLLLFLKIVAKVQESFAGGAPVSVPYSLVKKWTENFKTEIGRGAYGTVFSGIVLLPEGEESAHRQGRRVAVTRINAESILEASGRKDGSGELMKSIWNTIEALTSLRHPNIAHLVGHCLPSTEEATAPEHMMKELCLVHELAPHGSLDSCLGDDAKASDLPWQYRLKIAVGVAKGLCHMHSNSNGPRGSMHHRDLKSSNIALMADYDPKIFDYCLSEFVSASAAIGTSPLKGVSTLDYSRPYPHREGVEHYAKCEVFAFGIVLLELLTGKLQGYDGTSEQQTLLQDRLARGLLAADYRIQWPEGLVTDILKLAADCTSSYDERVDSVYVAMSTLDAMSLKYQELGCMDDDVLRMNRGLIARLESLQLQQDIRVMALETTHRCEICFEDNIPASKGVICGNRAHSHFFCGAERNDCFGEMVSFQSGDYGNFVRNSLSIVCGCCTALVPKVVTAFDASVVARHSSDGALTSFISANSHAVRREGQAALEDQRLQHLDEIHRLKEAAMADAARMAASTERHRLRIMDSIVTLHCPHCNLAILDFDGCFAVEHRSDTISLGHGCGLYFCGWCLAKFGSNSDCHVHVKICPRNLHPGTYFGEFPADFNSVHGASRRSQVLQYLRDNILDDKEREETTKAIRGDLSGLGIDI